MHIYMYAGRYICLDIRAIMRELMSLHLDKSSAVEQQVRMYIHFVRQLYLTSTYMYYSLASVN